MDLPKGTFTLKQHLKSMQDEPLILSQKVREILFRYTGCIIKIRTNRTISLNEILLTKKLNIKKNSFTYHVVDPYKV